jgi:hypothetical protein
LIIILKVMPPTSLTSITSSEKPEVVPAVLSVSPTSAASSSFNVRDDDGFV